MATITQTKLVGFGYGNKSNYNATAYANHIWFDPTNKQILLNGIEYIPKKLSELVNDSGFLTSITKSMVENVLTGNITSHTHTFASLTSKPTTLGGYGITDAMYFNERTKYLAARFNNTALATKAANTYIELWQDGAGWFNLKAGKFITSDGTSSQFLKGDGSLDSNAYALASDLSKYLPLTGGTLSGNLTCNGSYINMNNDSGAKGYKGYFNQSGTSNRASGSHVFMGNGQALGSNAISLGYNAYAGIRNQDADKGTYPYIAWQWMPSVKVNFTTTNQDTALGEFYGYEVLGGKMVQYELGGNTYTYENTSSSVRVLVCVKDDADTGLIFGGKSYMPFNSTKTLIQGKYILGRGESITNVNTITVGDVNYYMLAIYTWSPTVGYDYSTQVKVMCATKVNNSNYSGASSYASGYSSVASGAYSVASGNSSVASGAYSVASGNSSVASGAYSVASGYSSVASGYSSVASGYSSVASGYYSVASGAYSVASGNSSVASGANSVASGYYSVASGANSVASGYYSVASGYSSVASGYSSVASGYSSVASHDFSVVLARNGETQSSYQTIIGRYNAKVAGLFIIGNGSSSARSNALVVDESGNVTAKYFSGYANAVGGEGFKIYPENTNQINFGGTGSDNTIVFGAASKDSRSVPTTYKFGADGKATLLGGVTAFKYNYEGNNCDANVYTDGILWNYGNPAGWENAPQGMSYGSILTLKNSVRNDLSGQLAWDINHNSTTDTTRYLWWRATDAGDWVEAKWHQIAFTDSNVATATALTSSAGNATQPIYFSNGKPVACSYTLGKSVPSNAVFTDTTYSVATASTNGLMSSAMFKAKMVKSVGVRQGGTAVIEGGTITNHSVYITQDKNNLTGVYQQAVGENDVKIPNATTQYDGSMSYTDKKKLDKMPNTVFGFRLDIDDASTVSYDSPFGDYKIGGKDASVQDVNTIQKNNHYITLIAFEVTNNELKNRLQNSYVKFGYSSKDSTLYQTMRLLQSNFDGAYLYIEYIHTEPQYIVSFDCIWELY